MIATEDGILRIEGRINTMNDVTNSTKNPIILDGKHHFSRLLIKHYHERFLHGSPETVVNEIKQKYWILHLRPTVRSIDSQCYHCRIKRGKAQQPRMGDLPTARLGHHLRPFTYCGLDYFGPMTVTIGRRHEKRWGALFTCLTTRAIHLELASTLSTDSAIMALQRMSNRRGSPSKIHSDNGTNFTGMNSELKEEFKKMDHRRMYEEITNRGIRWRFIPPQTPHMGGSWERLVRSVKTALSIILKDRAPKEEIFMTLLTEVEHVINSRPLTHVSVDHRDQEALTLNHWLIGSSSGGTIRGEFTNNDLCSRKQWRTSQRLADMFWARWMKEFLPNLVVRKCWTQESRNLTKGDVVLLADSTMPRNVWPRGVITTVYPEKDGRIRIVEVQSRGRSFKRAANKIIVLVPASLGTKSLDSRTEGENMLTTELNDKSH